MTERTDSGHTSAHAPLRGIRVIDYGHFLAGPFLSRCLGLPCPHYSFWTIPAPSRRFSASR